MARFFSKLKSIECSCESKPIEGLTKQKWNECLFLIEGKDNGIPVWYYILVPYYKINQINNYKSGEIIQWNNFGNLIKYRDNNGHIYSSSGWGIKPSLIFDKWIKYNYGDCPFDENTKFEYSKDDIRICRIQRLISEELIGISRFYNKQNKFHYLKLCSNNNNKSLAFRSGIKNYDRLIYLNNIFVENLNEQELTFIFQNKLNYPLEFLVSNPSTYHYYKSNHLIIHQNLPTIQHLKPVFNISLSNENNSILNNIVLNNNYCVIQWENTNDICILSQSYIFNSPIFTKINQIYFIEYNKIYKKGFIKFIGSKYQCQNFIKNNLFIQLNYIDDDEDNQLISSNKKINNLNIKKSLIENLPNELFYEIFDYFKLEEINQSFKNLNKRINKLLNSMKNISFIFDKNLNESLIEIYKYQIKYLIIDNSNEINLNLFSNIISLKILNRNLNIIKQIQSKYFPYLQYLSFILKSDFKLPIELINELFSNKFKSLHYINLSYLDNKPFFQFKLSLQCPLIKKLIIRSNDINIIQNILLLCFNLKYFQINLLNNSNILINSSLKINHLLEKFIFWTDQLQITIDLIDYIFNLIKNIQYIYIQTNIRESFIYFIEKVYFKLKNLNYFHCYIKELIDKNETISNLNHIYQISSSFKSIQCIEDNQHFRIFSTD